MKIQMTAPVMQRSDQKSVCLIMPHKYNLKTIPKPKNKKIILKKIPARKYVVIRFSGGWSPEKMKAYTSKLDKYIKAEKLNVGGRPIYAYYNPPWTLPFMRRNEVLYLLKSK